MDPHIKKVYVPMTETAFYILLCLQKPNHGYGVVQTVEKLTDGAIRLAPGTMYGSLAKMEKDEENGMAPEVAGRFLARVALKKRVKPYYAIGLSYKFFVLLSRILPIRLIGWLLGLLYAGE